MFDEDTKMDFLREDYAHGNNLNKSIFRIYEWHQ